MTSVEPFALRLQVAQPGAYVTNSRSGAGTSVGPVVLTVGVVL